MGLYFALIMNQESGNDQSFLLMHFWLIIDTDLCDVGYPHLEMLQKSIIM